MPGPPSRPQPAPGPPHPRSLLPTATCACEVAPPPAHLVVPTCLLAPCMCHCYGACLLRLAQGEMQVHKPVGRALCRLQVAQYHRRCCAVPGCHRQCNRALHKVAASLQAHNRRDGLPSAPRGGAWPGGQQGRGHSSSPENTPLAVSPAAWHPTSPTVPPASTAVQPAPTAAPGRQTRPLPPGRPPPQNGLPMTALAAHACTFARSCRTPAPQAGQQKIKSGGLGSQGGKALPGPTDSHQLAEQALVGQHGTWQSSGQCSQRGNAVSRHAHLQLAPLCGQAEGFLPSAGLAEARYGQLDLPCCRAVLSHQELRCRHENAEAGQGQRSPPSLMAACAPGPPLPAAARGFAQLLTFRRPFCSLGCCCHVTKALQVDADCLLWPGCFQVGGRTLDIAAQVCDRGAAATRCLLEAAQQAGRAHQLTSLGGPLGRHPAEAAGISVAPLWRSPSLACAYCRRTAALATCGMDAAASANSRQRR